MANIVRDNIEIENARIFFKNFSGKEGKYNRAGDRNFCVAIDDAELAQKLLADGWNIRMSAPRDEYEEPSYYMSVAVSFKNIPPKVMLVTRRNMRPLTEETINMLDDADISNIDLIIRPYNWEVSGKSGVKAYLKTMYVTIEEDRFAAKYAEEEAPEEMPW